ncbi:MBL fold metallo-hydrolase [Haliscomenobacter hydrossis]|uniref:Rhodanese-like protein n=1 Tax=Haliscomenobacter hydrossis (strain ATCC 27775 / DSM 1100 / LMG 10767 / O) TaxID=760192 RepID=F4KV92_HALH1|nr:MBL fold metallo-hydrolase [Haliscomenobacter hydrossis]AEE50218.1 Rhodanese-like protein [Haliscomenobacter hydrossis DSM 1100]
MKVEQIYTGCLAEAAYYIESEGEAIIIDPLRETKPYLEKLAENGAKLKYIFETHFHADFVSGHIDLAEKTGATIVYGPTANTTFDIHQAKDGEVLTLGKISFKVLHTPGHTPESTTYLLKDEAGKEFAIFTGDTLFIGDVGRPDLAQKSGEVTQEDLAGWLYDSLREKIMTLPDEVLVYPGHGAGSACGKNMSKETWDTLGRQKQTNYALRADMSKGEFIKEVTAGLAPPPQYFAKNAKMNKSGYDSIDDVLQRGATPISADELELIVEAEGALVLDVRNEQEFKTGFVPNSIFIGIDGSFAPWVGALIPDLKQPIVLVTPEGREEEVVTRLARVGYDNTLGYLQGGIEAWKAAGKELDTIESIEADELAARMAAGEVDNLIDVRKPTEFISQHALAAENIPLDYINNNMHKLSPQNTYYLHCGGGYRSMVFASILRARGFENLIDIKGGWKAIEAQANIAKTDFACPTGIPQEVIDEAIANAI